QRPQRHLHGGPGGVLPGGGQRLAAARPGRKPDRHAAPPRDPQPPPRRAQRPARAPPPRPLHPTPHRPPPSGRAPPPTPHPPPPSPAPLHAAPPSPQRPRRPLHGGPGGVLPGGGRRLAAAGPGRKPDRHAARRRDLQPHHGRAQRHAGARHRRHVHATLHGPQ